MRISDWSSDVCSSDLLHSILRHPRPHRWRLFAPDFRQISQHLLLIGLNLLPNVCLSKWRFPWIERHPDKHPGGCWQGLPRSRGHVINSHSRPLFAAFLSTPSLFGMTERTKV